MTNGPTPEATFIQVCQSFGQEAHFTNEAKEEIKEGMKGRCFETRDKFKVQHKAQSELEKKLVPHFDMKVVYCEPEERVRVTDDTKIQVDDIVDRPYDPPASSRR